MQTFMRHAAVRLGCVLMLAVAGSVSRVESLCTTGPPICFAAPVDVSSVRGIDGTAQANPNNVDPIALRAGSVNLSITIGGTPGLRTFRVTQTAPGPAQGIVEAKDSLGAICTVAVSFRDHTIGQSISNLEICPMTSFVGEENYSLTTLSGPSVPSNGTTACSSHVVQCGDVPPAGLVYPSASRVLTVKSPIASAGGTPDVLMEVAKKGAFDGTLRMTFSRNGGSFSNITSSVFAGSVPFALVPATIIRGTGQWSDIRVIIGQQPGVIFPGVSVWGAAVLALLMLLVLIRFARRRAINAA